MQTSPNVFTKERQDLDAWLAGGHKGVFGKSGAGKSEVMKYLYEATGYRAVFITPHDDLPSGARARTPTEVVHLIARGSRRVVWRAPKEREIEGGREAAVRLLGTLTGGLLSIGKKLLKGDKAEKWVVVFIDEVHNFTSKVGYLGPVEELLSEGRKYGVICVLGSQRPARVSLEVLGQAETVVVLKMNPPDANYLKRAGYPVAEFEHHTDQDFHFVLMEGKQWTPYLPLPYDE